MNQVTKNPIVITRIKCIEHLRIKQFEHLVRMLCDQLYNNTSLQLQNCGSQTDEEKVNCRVLDKCQKLDSTTTDFPMMLNDIDGRIK
jgi:hypothetical protein